MRDTKVVLHAFKYESTRVAETVAHRYRLDILTFAVDWALKTSYLSSYIFDQQRGG